MSKEKFKEYTDLERDLEDIYQSPEPSDAFLNSLEARLEKAHRSAVSVQAPAQRPRPVYRWAAVPAVILFVLAVFVATVGPKNVLAQVQALIGYVPGVGFVDVNDTRVLLSPVSQTKDGVTVTVKQVMAGPAETYLVLGVDGLEPPEKLLEGYWPKDPEQDMQEWQTRYQALWESDGRLVLPDGTVMFGMNYQGAPWDGFYTMPILPADVLSATFEVTRLPGVPADKAPQGWSFDLEFGYVASPPATPEVGDLDYTPDTASGVLLPEASPVDAASEAVEGISLLVVDVVYAETETTVRLKIENIPLDWSYRYIDLLQGVLTDDLGNQYASIYGPVFGLQPDNTYILSFEPVVAEANTLTLSVDQISIGLEVEDKAITVDFGENPQIGSTIPIDSTVEILGTPLHFNAVTIEETEEYYTPDEVTLVTSYNFMLDPISLADKNLVVSGVMFAPEALQAMGAQNGSFGGGGGGGGGDQTPREISIFISMGIPADVPLPTGSRVLPIGEAQLNVMGSFVISWEVPQD